MRIFKEAPQFAYFVFNFLFSLKTTAYEAFQISEVNRRFCCTENIGIRELCA